MVIPAVTALRSLRAYEGLRGPDKVICAVGNRPRGLECQRYDGRTSTLELISGDEKHSEFLHYCSH